MRFVRSICWLGMALAPTVAAWAQEAAPTPPPPIDKQVQLQVWITETNQNGLRNIGGNLNFRRFVRGVEQSGSVQQVTTNVIDLAGNFNSVTLPAPDVPPFTPPMRPDLDNNLATGIQTLGGAGLTATIIDSDYGTVDALIRGAESRSDVDLISKPEILVINGSEASINAGSEVPFQQVDWKGNRPNLSVQWQKVGVNLSIVPTIQPNGTVDLLLKQLEVSDIARFDRVRGLDLPVVSTRSQTGRVSLPNGQMLVIGGLSSQVIRKTERRVPVLGKLPLVGMAFRGRRSEAEIKGLIIFVRPTIVDLRDMSPRAESALHFWRKRSADWKNGKAIEREISALQEEL